MDAPDPADVDLAVGVIVWLCDEATFDRTLGVGAWAERALERVDSTQGARGKVVMAAYYNAFVDLVHYAQAQQPGAQQANAPIVAQKATTDVHLRTGPSTDAPSRYTVHTGALVYPTGKRDGIWMEVDDENGNRGWMSSAMATSR